ncbi:helix-turn-helix transcriptional regulator [Nocardioides albus]|uniref:Putative ArsR family transcriptional regulator n=1 Tax=Nocardioides albus TaxID=1841 RepID=A0A7W5A6X0_9ACTN|nr:LuxR family transcriptional regulator [Nocardioides albus]MBB3090530.1 putative ArsR family transcriptional regulator [Nocardioides albus]GGU24541.1 transcriptional regulator [Nocardioides albus]
MTGELSAQAWIGIDAETERLYQVALTVRGPLEVAALAAAGGVSEDAARAAIERLRELGFLTSYGVLAPSTALRALHHRRVSERQTELAELETAAGVLDELASGFVTAAPEVLAAHGIELVRGVEEVGRRASALISSARTELMVLNAPPYAQNVLPPYAEMPKGPPAAESETGLAVLRGVHVRNVMAPEGLDLPGRMAAVSELADLGMGVRIRADLPTKLMIADRTTAMLPPSMVADPLESALIIHDGLLANALVPLFEATWDTALPLAAVQGGSDASVDPSGPPTAEERALLTLLASGLKDEGIARQLDVHVHTARRRISALLAKLGASTRFQAGVQAGRRGWLE